MRRAFFLLLMLVLVIASVPMAQAGSSNKNIQINVLLNTDATDAILTELGGHGKVREVLYQIDAVTMQAPASELAAIQALPFVAAASPDAERTGAPIDTVAATDFLNGLNTWDQDAVDVTDAGVGRVEAYNGEGVYVAVLDTGLHDSWRTYFPEERIAVEYAKAFAGGANDSSNTAEPTNMWEHDQNGHGTHVTSTILGYNLRGTPINGVAPMAKVIPVKVLGQSGSGTSGMVAAGIVYVADLKAGPLADHPVVINMSLGGSALDAIEKAALDYAIEKGVIIVASAGNSGEFGMGYPGAYAPVISVAASGWTGEWASGGSWWLTGDVADPTSAADFYITDFSSRELPGQELDVAAPGSWVVGPYQLNSGNNKPSYYFLGGTSMASPHVAGVAALLMQQDPTRTQAEVEAILKNSAIPLPAGCREITDVSGAMINICWGDDASGSGMVSAQNALNYTE